MMTKTKTKNLGRNAATAVRDAKDAAGIIIHHAWDMGRLLMNDTMTRVPTFHLTEDILTLLLTIVIILVDQTVDGRDTGLLNGEEDQEDPPTPTTGGWLNGWVLEEATTGPLRGAAEAGVVPTVAVYPRGVQVEAAATTPGLAVLAGVFREAGVGAVIAAEVAGPTAAEVDREAKAAAALLQE
mmetsp:Transcript_12484/g.18969  ORF Transcript_12484/g.18969 Transcript_12484/m.18969 type:complete len:183 (+) Transcript_12484:236-784(+)